MTDLIVTYLYFLGVGGGAAFVYSACYPKILTFKFVWYDLWVGAYWKRSPRTLYIVPFPCCVLIFNLERP